MDQAKPCDQSYNLPAVRVQNANATSCVARLWYILLVFRSWAVCKAISRGPSFSSPLSSKRLCLSISRQVRASAKFWMQTTYWIRIFLYILGSPNTNIHTIACALLHAGWKRGTYYLKLFLQNKSKFEPREASPGNVLSLCQLLAENLIWASDSKSPISTMGISAT